MDTVELHVINKPDKNSQLKCNHNKLLEQSVVTPIIFIIMNIKEAYCNFSTLFPYELHLQFDY